MANAKLFGLRVEKKKTVPEVGQMLLKIRRFSESMKMFESVVSRVREQ